MSLWPALLTAVLLGASAGPVHSCRSPQRLLERYFEEAEIVVVGRVTAVKAVTPPEGQARLEVSVAPPARP